MTELDKLLESKSHLQPNTLLSYKNAYKKLKDKTDKDLYTLSNDEILTLVKSISSNPSVEQTYLNIPIMIKMLYDLPIDELITRRDELKTQRQEYTEKRNEGKAEILPNYQELETFLKTKYEQGSYVAYILNYLLLHYGFRNKDMDLFITKKKEPKDTSINYLIVGKDNVTLKINEYKTLKNYGPKKITTTNKEFVEIVKKLKPETWLLNVNGEHIKETSLNKSIQRHLYNKLTEGDYFKIVIDHIMTKKNSLELLKNLSQTRGTDYKTIVNHYNIQEKKPKEPKKPKEEEEEDIFANAVYIPPEKEKPTAKKEKENKEPFIISKGIKRVKDNNEKKYYVNLQYYKDDKYEIINAYDYNEIEKIKDNLELGQNFKKYFIGFYNKTSKEFISKNL